MVDERRMPIMMKNHDIIVPCLGQGMSVFHSQARSKVKDGTMG